MKNSTKIRLPITAGLALGWVLVFLVLVSSMNVATISCSLTMDSDCSPQLNNTLALSYSEIGLFESIEESPSYQEKVAPLFTLVNEKKKLDGSVSLVFSPIKVKYKLKQIGSDQIIHINDLGHRVEDFSTDATESSVVLVEVSPSLEQSQSHQIVTQVLDTLSLYQVPVGSLLIEQPHTIVVRNDNQWRALIDTADSTASIQRLAAIIQAPEIADQTSLQRPFEIDARLQMPVLRNFK